MPSNPGTHCRWAIEQERDMMKIRNVLRRSWKWWQCHYWDGLIAAYHLPPSENIFVYFLFDTYRLTITCKAIYRLTILLDYPLLDRAVVALVLIFAYLLCTSSESTPGREREEADLIWREVKFPEYRNSISGHFHVKRAALISICRKGGSGCSSYRIWARLDYKYQAC